MNEIIPNLCGSVWSAVLCLTAALNQLFDPVSWILFSAVRHADKNWMLIAYNELLSPTCLIFPVNEPTHVWCETSSIDRQPSTGRMEEKEYKEQEGEAEEEEEGEETCVSSAGRPAAPLFEIKLHRESRLERQVGLIISGVLLRSGRELPAWSWADQPTAFNKTCSWESPDLFVSPWTSAGKEVFCGCANSFRGPWHGALLPHSLQEVSQMPTQRTQQ